MKSDGLPLEIPSLCVSSAISLSLTRFFRSCYIIYASKYFCIVWPYTVRIIFCIWSWYINNYTLFIIFSRLCLLIINNHWLENQLSSRQKQSTRSESGWRRWRQPMVERLTVASISTTLCSAVSFFVFNRRTVQARISLYAFSRTHLSLWIEAWLVEARYVFM